MKKYNNESQSPFNEYTAYTQFLKFATHGEKINIVVFFCYFEHVKPFLKRHDSFLKDYKLARSRWR